jgi:hypothetical protein
VAYVINIVCLKYLQFKCRFVFVMVSFRPFLLLGRISVGIVRFHE